MEKKNLWILLGKQLSGEITTKERIVLQKLIKEDKQDLSYLIEFLEEQWKKIDTVKTGTDPRFDERWSRLSARLFDDALQTDGDAEDRSMAPQRHGLLTRFSWYGIAACLLLGVGMLYYMHGRPVDRPAGRHEIVVKNGAKRHISLPDGTNVWLNAGSKLSYGGGFADKDRDIWLEGEGFFTVAGDPSTIFTVRTKDVTIQALGTTFNVKAYADEGNIQTTLISGKVQVLLKDDPDKKILLSPHEKLTVMSGAPAMMKASDSMKDKTGPRKNIVPLPRVNELKYQVQMLPLNPVDSNYFAETAWVKNKLAFVYEPFGHVAKKMERRYNVHIIFKDKDLSKVIMSGVFDKENISQALDVLRMITKFNYRVAGDSIYLYKSN